MDNGWLLPTPTAREGKGSNRCMRRRGRDHSSIRNLDLSEIVELIVSEDPRVMTGIYEVMHDADDDGTWHD